MLVPTLKMRKRLRKIHSWWNLTWKNLQQAKCDANALQTSFTNIIKSWFTQRSLGKDFTIYYTICYTVYYTLYTTMLYVLKQKKKFLFTKKKERCCSLIKISDASNSRNPWLGVLMSVNLALISVFETLDTKEYWLNMITLVHVWNK